MASTRSLRLSLGLGAGWRSGSQQGKLGGAASTPVGMLDYDPAKKRLPIARVRVLGTRADQARYVLVGLLDDDPAKKRLSIAGVRVLGTRADLARIIRTTNATALLVAAPTADNELITSLTELAAHADETLTVKVLPAVSELIDGHVDVNDIRDVNEVDLLGRHQIETDISEIAGYLRGKRVLVTGAGGSIGSELCRQIHRYSPGELMMLDRDESALSASPDSRSSWGFVSELSRSWVSELSRSRGVRPADSLRVFVGGSLTY